MTSSLDTSRIKVKPVFARHETFHPRFGWLKKGFDAAQENPQVFLKEDAPVTLGVGKNMVKSIRYWCNTFKVLSEDRTAPLGKKLLADGGWDSFLENPASLWLLHWNLLKPTCEAATWYFTFNHFRAAEFSDGELLQGLRGYRDSHGKSIVDESLKKDINCLLKMYVEPRNPTGFLEDSIDCPFTELRLINDLGDSRRYTFRVGAKSNLPPEIIVAACLEYATFVSEGAKTITISRLLYDEGSPGMVFKLSESAMVEGIEQVAKNWKNLALSSTAGLIQFSFQEEPQALADAILEAYYRTPHG